MSRSVKEDYDKLRAPKLGGLVKLAAVVHFTDEQIFDARSEVDPRYARKAEGYNISPTNEDWAKYHRARAGLLALRNYENTVGLEDIEVPMPKPTTYYRFTETHEAWLERCRALDAEQEAAA